MTDEDLTTEQPNDSDLIKKLRNEVRRFEKDNKSLNRQLREEKSTTTMYKVGATNLNERQQRAVLRELAELDGEPSTDDVQEIIKDLGYSQQGQGQPQGQQVEQSGQQVQNGVEQNQQPVIPGGVGDDFTNAQAPNVDPNQFNPLNNPNQAPNPQQQSAQAMMNMQANSQQQTVGTPSLAEQIQNAKTPEELRNLIRSQGAPNGIKHQWDS